MIFEICRCCFANRFLDLLGCLDCLFNRFAHTARPGSIVVWMNGMFGNDLVTMMMVMVMMMVMLMMMMMLMIMMMMMMISLWGSNKQSTCVTTALPNVAWDSEQGTSLQWAS